MFVRVRFDDGFYAVFLVCCIVNELQFGRPPDVWHGHDLAGLMSANMGRITALAVRVLHHPSSKLHIRRVFSPSTPMESGSVLRGVLPHQRVRLGYAPSRS